MFEQLNKNRKLFNVDIEKPVFKKLSDFEENVILKVLGCYINKKSIYGSQPIFIFKIDNNIYFVNVPKRHTETINIIINNTEMIDAINNGQCYVKIEKYFSKAFNKDCFDFVFVDHHKDDDIRIRTHESDCIF